MLYYKTYKNDNTHEWTVLVHGAGGSSAIWFKQIKEFKKNFNVLLVDLRGHGRSKDVKKLQQHYSFDDLTKDIIEVLNHLKIRSAHFIGISLGTVIIRNLAELEPRRIKSMVLGGAVTGLNNRVKTLITLGNLGKKVLPYMWLYKLFAWCLMPRKRHKTSRLVFVEQAKKLCQKEFIKWFSLTKHINSLLTRFNKKRVNIPTLYIMGEEDYMFLTPVKEIVRKCNKTFLTVIKDSGHVCNIDQPEIFNDTSIKFLKNVGTQKYNSVYSS
ncbi:alpha/beta fold hydrolase [Bacillus sp. MRMR6]|uniref:alpha/beta fold hydrolase n=1 Tax=Bacillus sp. MRMR6 TaxID=1928617 RepID=UPI00095146AA|nr:alpha/beta hydrolase [Bacillus sp. MRMR6]OLS37222.1 2-succinyl-6-hydroxy-2,4-cyclohexadiene-1-carboxylate synthase [Bacillus sp. MRMR6]